MILHIKKKNRKSESARCKQEPGMMSVGQKIVIFESMCDSCCIKVAKFKLGNIPNANFSFVKVNKGYVLFFYNVQ